MSPQLLIGKNPIKKIFIDTNLVDKIYLDKNPAYSSELQISYVENDDDGTLMVTGLAQGYENIAILDIPSKINGKNVTSIQKEAFNSKVDLISVTIPSSITSIGDGAFSGCFKLVEVINKSALDIKTGEDLNGYIGFYALEIHRGTRKVVNRNGYLFYTFDGVNYLLGKIKQMVSDELVSIELPSSYNNDYYEIYNYAFWKCNDINEVNTGAGVTKIMTEAFSYCEKLTSIRIGQNVNSVATGAFDNSSILASILVDDNNQKYKGIDGNLYSKDGTVLFQYACGKTEPEFFVPDHVATIWDYAFAKALSLTKVYISGNVRTIMEGAFFFCAITEAILYEGVKEISGGAFTFSSYLTKIYIPSTMLKIGEDAFSLCESLTSIIYAGTEEQWNNIQKGENWDGGNTSYTIQYNTKPE